MRQGQDRLNFPTVAAGTLATIDEPEVSLHPELLSVLADSFREASNRTPLVIATHSDRLVRFLTPDEVITANMEQDGTTSFRWGSKFELDQWL
jgi:predicted ATPase